MSDAEQEARENSLLSEIHSLAPYFSYDQGKQRNEESSNFSASPRLSPVKAGAPARLTWEERMKT